MSNGIILAIETSCDETAISVLRFKHNSLEVLSNEVSSQVKLHAKWGGVVPNLAAREHVKNITPILELSLINAGIEIKDICLIAVTEGPGLIPALMIGTNFAKTLAYLWKKPLIGIHHIEGHIYANFVGGNPKSKIQNPKNRMKFPALALVVSGGHTQLVLMKDHLKYEIVGQTLDDAVGEAFDKVARILDIGYPGGPAVSAMAEKFQNPNDKFQIKSDTGYEIRDTKYKIRFPRPMMKKQGFNFSFSGLKTAVLYETKKHLARNASRNEAGGSNPSFDKSYIAAICHEFQQAAIDVLIHKTLKAAEKHNVKTIMLAGGVSANTELRKQLDEAITEFMPDTYYIMPDTSLTGDNAAMIAAAAAFRWQKMNENQKKKVLDSWKTLQPDANLKLN